MTPTPNPTPTPQDTQAVDTAITTRRSLRAFLPTPIPRATIEAILSVAARAPSGTNTQPWKVYVLTGEAKAELSREAGASDVILYTQQNFETEVKRLTGGKGVDVVYDSVGKTTFDGSLNCLHPRGLLAL